MEFSITCFGQGVGLVMLGWMAGIAVNLAYNAITFPMKKS